MAFKPTSYFVPMFYLIQGPIAAAQLIETHLAF